MNRGRASTPRAQEVGERPDPRRSEEGDIMNVIGEGEGRGASRSRCRGSAAVRPSEHPESDPPARHEPEGFDDDPARELRMPVFPFSERDRDLCERPSSEPGPHHQLHLEAVAVGMEGLSDEVLEELASVRAVAARGVVQGEPEHQASVGVAHPRERQPDAAPVGDGATRHVPAPDDQVGPTARGLEERAELRRVVGQIRVHLHDQVEALLERPAEALLIGAPEPRPGRALDEPESRLPRHQLADDAGRSVR